MNTIDDQAAERQHNECVALIGTSSVDVKRWLLARKGARVSASATIRSIDATPLDLARAQAVSDKITGLIASLNKLDGDIRKHMVTNNLWTDDQYLKDFEICESYLDTLRYNFNKVQIQINSLTATSNAAQPPQLPGAEIKWILKWPSLKWVCLSSMGRLKITVNLLCSLRLL